MWGNIPFSYNKHESVLGRQGKNHPSIAGCSQNTTVKQWSKMEVKCGELCGVHLMVLLIVHRSFLGGHSAPGALWQLLGGLPNWTFVVVFLYLLKKIFYWRIISLQCCSGLCHTSVMMICTPFLLSLPLHLCTPLGHHGVPGWAPCVWCLCCLPWLPFRSRWGCISAAPAGRPTVLPGNGVTGPCLGDTVSVSLSLKLFH